MTEAGTGSRREPETGPTRTEDGVVPAAPMDVAPELFPATADGDVSGTADGPTPETTDGRSSEAAAVDREGGET